MLALGVSVQSWAANDTNGNWIRIDTFGADVQIKATGRIIVKRLVITAYTSAKTITFIGGEGTVLVLECPAGDSITLQDLDFYNGLTFDDSESDLAANDFIFLWVKR